MILECREDVTTYTSVHAVISCSVGGGYKEYIVAADHCNNNASGPVPTKSGVNICRQKVIR